MRAWLKVMGLVGVAGLALLSCSKNAGSIAAGSSKLFASAPPEIKAAWDAATAAMKTNDYAGAILTFQKLQAQPGLTAEQRQAVDTTVTAVSDAMYAAANRGDPAGKQAIEDLRKVRTR